jgi:hypothetical protein
MLTPDDNVGLLGPHISLVAKKGLGGLVNLHLALESHALQSSYQGQFIPELDLNLAVMAHQFLPNGPTTPLILIS